MLALKIFSQRGRRFVYRWYHLQQWVYTSVLLTYIQEQQSDYRALTFGGLTRSLFSMLAHEKYVQSALETCT